MLKRRYGQAQPHTIRFALHRRSPRRRNRRPTCRHPILSSRRLETTASTGTRLTSATQGSSVTIP
jgi:hypothetical protein